MTASRAAGRVADILPGLRAFAIPMRTRFRGITVREGALIEGPAGWAEFSPFADYGPRECARWLACALEAAYEGWPAARRDHVPVNAIVPAVAPERAHALVTASGCTTVKVKVAERAPGVTGPGGGVAGRVAAVAGLHADIARVEAVRDALGPAGRIRIDANGGWGVAQAEAALRVLGRFGLEYAEQPCASLAEMAELRRRTDVPLAADESIRRAEDPLAVAAAAAADVAVIKVQPLGGVRAALAIAEACGLPVVVSSAVETSVGLSAGLALAAALPDLSYACGLDTMSLLTGDVTAEPLVSAGGLLPVRRPGVEPGRLADYEVGAREWRARIRAAAQYLDTL